MNLVQANFVTTFQWLEALKSCQETCGHFYSRVFACPHLSKQSCCKRLMKRNRRMTSCHLPSELLLCSPNKKKILCSSLAFHPCGRTFHEMSCLYCTLAFVIAVLPRSVVYQTFHWSYQIAEILFVCEFSWFQDH